MEYNDVYSNQVKLLLTVLPFVAKEKCFALKGGTAINLFLRNMPRLSVDIDLTYLPIEDRSTTLRNVEFSLLRIKNNLLNEIDGIQVDESRIKTEQCLSKLFIMHNGLQIVIEPNLILRGSVFPCVKKNLVQNAEDFFKLTIIDMLNMSIEDLYAGKMCAALDRQHPRDLFDIKLLLENEGITDSIRKAFVIYLASGPRPMHELLSPNLLEIKKIFEQDFLGMTQISVNYDSLITARSDMIKTLQKTLNQNERLFLLSVKEGNPDWQLIGRMDLENLPAVQWKVANVKRMDSVKHAQALGRLKAVLEL